MNNKVRESGDIDPEIADLLGDDTSPVSIPDFSDLFGDDSASVAPESEHAEDLSKKAFPSILKWDQDPDPVFFEKNYYSKVLTGEGELAQRVHTLLQKFLKTEDPQERGVYRQRLVNGWWELARSLSSSYQSGSSEKRWALRFGYLLPTLVSPDQRKMLSKVIQTNTLEEPVHYADEWLDLVLHGEVNPLATDELKPSQVNDKSKAKAQLEKAKGNKEANLSVLKNLQSRRNELEADLKAQTNALTVHAPNHMVPGLTATYTPEQKISLTRISELVRNLSKTDREIQLNYDRFKDANAELGKIDSRIEQMGGLDKADKGAMESEIDSLRQMAKLCVGRQGNHLPFLMKSFFTPNMDMMGTRENVIRAMDQVEQVDPGVFQRTFRQKSNRIVPHVIILACYGDKGICWEPFERFNRSTSRGRVAIPMFPKNIKLAVINALGDLRWNVAKEKAAHYWMEEGLTGHYYQWFSSKKLRGDVRLRFLDDYALWVTKEVDGVQKLDKDVRGIFWRHIPFPQPIKDTLRNRGFVYNELFKKDMNRAASDGY